MYPQFLSTSIRSARLLTACYRQLNTKMAPSLKAKKYLYNLIDSCLVSLFLLSSYNYRKQNNRSYLRQCVMIARRQSVIWLPTIIDVWTLLVVYLATSRLEFRSVLARAPNETSATIKMFYANQLKPVLRRPESRQEARSVLLERLLL